MVIATLALLGWRSRTTRVTAGAGGAADHRHRVVRYLPPLRPITTPSGWGLSGLLNRICSGSCSWDLTSGTNVTIHVAFASFLQGELLIVGTRRDTGHAALTIAQQPSLPARPPEVGTWLHDVVDLASGRVDTTPIKRPPSGKTRMQRLIDVGFAADPLIFPRPRYRLTPRRPYRASPQAWLDAFFNSAIGAGRPDDFFGVYEPDPGADQIWWRVPPSFGDFEFWATCNFSFAGLGAGQAVMSLSFEVWPYQGGGAVVIDVAAQQVEIPITGSAARSVDIGFVHNGDPLLVAMVLLRPGIYDFVFHSVELRSGPAVIHPPPPSPPLP